MASVTYQPEHPMIMPDEFIDEYEVMEPDALLLALVIDQDVYAVWDSDTPPTPYRHHQVVA